MSTFLRSVVGGLISAVERRCAVSATNYLLLSALVCGCAAGSVGGMVGLDFVLICRLVRRLIRLARSVSLRGRGRTCVSPGEEGRSAIARCGSGGTHSGLGGFGVFVGDRLVVGHGV